MALQENQGVSGAGDAFWRIQERIWRLFLPATRGCWHSLAPGHIIPNCLHLSVNSGNLGKSSHFKFFNLITSAKFLFPCKAAYSQVPGIRTWLFTDAMIQLTGLPLSSTPSHFFTHESGGSLRHLGLALLFFSLAFPDIKSRKKSLPDRRGL